MRPKSKSSQSRADAKFRQAFDYQRQGRISEAEKIYREILKQNPKHLDSIQMLGVVCRKMNKKHEALALLKLAASLTETNAGVYNNLGNVLADLEQYEEACAAFSKALQLKPDLAMALINRSESMQSLGRFQEALADAQQAIKISPDFHDAYISMGNLLNRTGRYDEAIQAYQGALHLKPGNPGTFSNLGATYMELKRYSESENYLNAALQADPNSVSALNNRANLYKALKRPEEALADIEAALRLNPNHAEANLNRGNILQDLQRIPEAISSYKKALELRPSDAFAYNNAGNALKEIGQSHEALECYEQAIRINPRYAEAHYHRGVALNDLQREQEAAAAFEKAVEYKEDHPMLFGQWVASHMMICYWRDMPEKIARLTEKICSGKNASTPFSLLSLGLAPEVLKQCATIFIQEQFWDRSQNYAFPKPHANPRIRVGYFSSDFRSHAVSQLAVGLFECHDKEKFEVLGFNTSNLPPDAMTARVDLALGGLIPLGSLSIQNMVEKTRLLSLDIAIDLNGHTKGAKTDLFAHRVAPIQVNYLGYPGTSGAPFMDYILGDEVIIPSPHFSHYTEKVAHLPYSYLPNDSKKVIAQRTPTRAEQDLPDNAFVFCCFNNSFKFSPETFDLWMRLLRRVSGSVLWLSQVNKTAMHNLRERAFSQGIDRERLIFAPRTEDLADHLARHRLADLFLDTTLYNAHTTASDALWSGLPVLTCMGNAFPGRVAASLLRAIDLPELITNSLGEYEALAFRLATNPEELAHLKNKLIQNRNAMPLFNTQLFARGMESLFTRMWQRYQLGEPPDHLLTNASF